MPPRGSSYSPASLGRSGDKMVLIAGCRIEPPCFQVFKCGFLFSLKGSCPWMSPRDTNPKIQLSPFSPSAQRAEPPTPPRPCHSVTDGRPRHLQTLLSAKLTVQVSRHIACVTLFNPHNILICMPIAQMSKLKFGERKLFSQGYSTRKHQSQV